MCIFDTNMKQGFVCTIRSKILLNKRKSIQNLGTYNCFQIRYFRFVIPFALIQLDRRRRSKLYDIRPRTCSSSLFLVKAYKREKQIYLVTKQKFKPILYFKPKNQKSKFIQSQNQKFKPLLYFNPKNQKSKFIQSQNRNSSFLF